MWHQADGYEFFDILSGCTQRFDCAYDHLVILTEYNIHIRMKLDKVFHDVLSLCPVEVRRLACQNFDIRRFDSCHEAFAPVDGGG